MDNLEYLIKKGESSKKNKNLDSLHLFFTQEELDTLSKRSIAIVGTNGKTSTANYIFNYLETYDISVVQFTSPHLMKVNERILSYESFNETYWLDNNKNLEGLPYDPDTSREWITDLELDKYLELVKHFERMEKIVLGYFEALFLIACRYFLDRNRKWFIVEAGIGGRLDTTSIINSETVVLTNVGLDHTEVLGASHIEILKEKIHISKRVKKFYVGDSTLKISEGISKDFEFIKGEMNFDDEHIIDIQEALSNGPVPIDVEWFIKGELNLDDEDIINIHSSHLFKDRVVLDDVNVPLDGTELGARALKALRISEDFRQQNHHLARAVFKDIHILEFPPPLHMRYLDEYSFGRFELLDQRANTVKVIDGAHNGEAISAFFCTLRKALKKNAPDHVIKQINDEKYGPFECFVGLKKGKRYKAIADALIGQSDLNINISLIERDTFNEQMDPSIIAEYLTELGVEYKIATLDHFHYYSGPSILIGSLYLVGEYKMKYPDGVRMKGWYEDADNIFHD